jgi:hypothetical protein
LLRAASTPRKREKLPGETLFFRFQTPRHLVKSHFPLLVMARRSLNVGMIGYNFMGKAHSNAWRQAPKFFDLPADVVLHTICGRSPKNVEASREQPS